MEQKTKFTVNNKEEKAEALRLQVRVYKLTFLQHRQQDRPTHIKVFFRLENRPQQSPRAKNSQSKKGRNRKKSQK